MSEAVFFILYLNSRLFRCVSTVAELMNNLFAISTFVNPSAISSRTSFSLRVMNGKNPFPSMQILMHQRHHDSGTCSLIYRWMAFVSSCLPTFFKIYPEAPFSIIFITNDLSSNVLRPRTCIRGYFCFTSRHNSIPLLSGILMSISTTSGWLLSRKERQDVALEA